MNSCETVGKAVNKTKIFYMGLVSRLPNFLDNNPEYFSTVIDTTDFTECRIIELVGGVFPSSTRVRNVKLPECLVNIKEGVFQHSSEWLLTVNLHECKNLKSIGKDSFASCCSIEELKFPESLEMIGEGAFYDCSRLKNVDFSKCKNLKIIDERAFCECRCKVMDLSECKKLKHIGMGAFKESNIELLKLPEGFFKNDCDVKQAVTDMFKDTAKNVTVMCGDKIVYEPETRIKTNAENLGKDESHILSQSSDKKSEKNVITFDMVWKPHQK